MENLNKSQIILLTLLVSFVTSIATGIVTVTLLDQAPPGVTRTINRIVERTIETVIPGENQITTITKEIIIKEEDLIPDAIERSSKSIVEIKAVDNEGEEIALGLGVVISGDGYFVTDKNNIEGNSNNLVVKYNGVTLSADIVSSNDDEFAILKMSLLDIDLPVDDSTTKEDVVNKYDEVTELPIFTPASLADSNDIRLGQTVLAFDDGVKMGIVSSIKKENIRQEEINESAENEILIDDKNNFVSRSYIITNITLNNKSIGGPLVSTNGDIFGISIINPQDGDIVIIPVNRVKNTFFEIINSLIDEIESLENIKNSEEISDGDIDLTESQ